MRHVHTLYILIAFTEDEMGCSDITLHYITLNSAVNIGSGDFSVQE
jgi:hypothetical protein